MSYRRPLSLSLLLLACGGTTTTPNDGGVDGTSNDSATQDSAAQDSAAQDAAADVIALDAAECVPPNTDCQTSCPQGTVCLVSNGPIPHDLGCTTIPPECNGTASCSCMADCFCPPTGFNKCTQSGDTLTCDNGTKSRREFKKDISYVTNDERAVLAEQALQTRLAEYRYKTEPESTPPHLGFIIDDMPETSHAVQADRTHVDLYGYTSMLLATVQEQQKQIDELKKQVDALKKK